MPYEAALEKNPAVMKIDMTKTINIGFFKKIRIPTSRPTLFTIERRKWDQECGLKLSDTKCQPNRKYLDFYEAPNSWVNF